MCDILQQADMDPQAAYLYLRTLLLQMQLVPLCLLPRPVPPGIAAATAAGVFTRPCRCLCRRQAVESGRLASDPVGVREVLCGALVEVWQRLRWCASTRGKLRDVRRLMEVELDTGAATSTQPLLRQVLSKILLQVRQRWSGLVWLTCFAPG